MDNITRVLGSTDIYLIDQIMKGRYKEADRILDAGCGAGRNLNWFVHTRRKIFGIDRDADAIANIGGQFPELISQLHVGGLTEMPYEKAFFDHIISSAVLHFAENTEHFYELLAEHLRVLRPRGTFFIRMASDIGIEDQLSFSQSGIYRIPDGSNRFLLTRALLQAFLHKFDLRLVEPLKTTNVSDLRCMSTLILSKV